MKYLTTDQAQEKLGLTKCRFLQKVHNGEYNLHKCIAGRCYLFSEEEILSKKYKRYGRTKKK